MSGALLESEIQAELVMEGNDISGGTFRRLAEWIIDLGSASAPPTPTTSSSSSPLSNRLDRASYLLCYRRFGLPKELFSVFLDRYLPPFLLYFLLLELLLILLSAGMLSSWLRTMARSSSNSANSSTSSTIGSAIGSRRTSSRPKRFDDISHELT